jgi:uncharacterized protein YndB with AHSA1/START domain
MIKKLLFGLLGLVVALIAVVAVLSFVAPKDFKVEREVTINRPKTAVFDYLKMLKHQDTWGPWAKKDPAMKREFRGNDGYVGFVSVWDSDKPDVGAGEQEIKKITEGERIDTELRFKKPFESTSDAYMITEAVGPDQTKVKWVFTGSMPRPMNIMLMMMDMDKEVGKDFGEGLANLKKILETPPIVN